MQPSQPIYGSAPQPTQGPNPDYDFIVNYDKHHRNNWLLTASLKTRIFVVGGGLFALLLISWIFIALLSSAGSVSTAGLIDLTQRQNELVHLATIASTQAKQQPTIDFAASLRLSAQSDQNQLLSYLNLLHAKPSNEVLILRQSSTVDKQLTTAAASGAFDQTFVTTVQAQLATYIQALQQTYKSASTPTERQLLSQEYNHAQLLLTQSKQTE